MPIPNKIRRRDTAKETTRIIMLKKLLYSATIVATTFLFVSCEKSDEYKEYQEYDPYEHQWEQFTYTDTGLYLGITGFNSDLHYYYNYSTDRKFSSLNQHTSPTLCRFVSELKTDDGTVLYYAMDRALSLLEKSRFPNDLQNVSIITFTDGLDQGSSVKNPDYQSATAYLEALQQRIRSTQINGLNINAYSIGLKGQDVKDDVLFRSNLNGLASSDDNVMEVTSMDEVNEKFMQLAASLYKENTSQTLKLTIPQPYNNTRIRFTFDIDTENDAANSTCYIEGVFNNGSLTQIEYKGLTSSSGTTVQSQSEGSINVSFSFSNLQLETGNELSASLIKQWEWIESSSLWQVNSEFNPGKSTETTVEKQSAVIMLLLDCSSSLGDDLEQVKLAARNFITTLSGASNGKIDPTSQVRFQKKEAYTYVPQLCVLDIPEKNCLAKYDFGTDSGTSPYYEIPAGYHTPAYLYQDNLYYSFIETEPYTYYFVGGNKYTLICSDDGTYLTFDIEYDQ